MSLTAPAFTMSLMKSSDQRKDEHLSPNLRRRERRNRRYHSLSTPKDTVALLVGKNPVDQLVIARKYMDAFGTNTNFVRVESAAQARELLKLVVPNVLLLGGRGSATVLSNEPIVKTILLECPNIKVFDLDDAQNGFL